MRPPDELDVIRDALGLIEAAHRDDLEGAEVLLGNANCRLVAGFLARVACDLIEDVTESPAETLALLRERHAGGGSRSW